MIKRSIDQSRNLRRIRPDIVDPFTSGHIERNGSESFRRFIRSAAGDNSYNVDEGLRCNGIFQMFKHIQQRLIVVFDDLLGFVGQALVLSDDSGDLCF